MTSIAHHWICVNAERVTTLQHCLGGILVDRDPITGRLRWVAEALLGRAKVNRPPGQDLAAGSTTSPTTASATHATIPGVWLLTHNVEPSPTTRTKTWFRPSETGTMTDLPGSSSTSRLPGPPVSYPKWTVQPHSHNGPSKACS